MKTKIVYILVSDNTDVYLEQALISVYSLRKYNPDTFVELVVDKETNATLINGRAQIKNYVTTINQVNVPDSLTKKQRSRYIKTSLRELVKGDYFCIDTDTVIVGDLSIVDSIQSDIAMCYDANSPFPVGSSNSFGDRYINKYTQKVGWESLKGCYHYNSGVVYAKDCARTRKLYEKWHENWQVCLNNNIFVDEPALTRANKEIGGFIERLDDTLNWQVQRHGCNIPVESKILHYFASDRNYSAFIFAQKGFQLQIKENGLCAEIIDFYLDNIDKAYLRVTYVINEEDYALLKDMEYYPLFQIRKTHPSLFLFFNTIVVKMRKFNALIRKIFK